jgi:outer membrane receptor for ferrienterochelin and colicins
MHRFALILITLFAVQATLAQSSLTGKILDSLTHKPIPFVNVFFANTTIGTVSDTIGSFKIRNITNGKYDLTFSFV